MVNKMEKLRDDLKCRNLVVITGDYESTDTIEWYGVKEKIQFILLWKWLLILPPAASKKKVPGKIFRFQIGLK